MAEWLLPFAGRLSSGPTGMNFLWKHGCIYAMDNHRAALWSWWQQLENRGRWAFLHIDRHYDSAGADVGKWRTNYRATHRESLSAYLEATYRDDDESLLLYRWDNIVSGLLALSGSQLDGVVFATGRRGAVPTGVESEEWDLWHLVDQLEQRLLREPNGALRWIVDIDLDYFTSEKPHETRHVLIAPAVIARIGEIVDEAVTRGSVGALTIALSPETAGGWGLSEAVLETLTSRWKVRPELPSVQEGVQSRRKG